jgi:hypothetical protein
MLCVVAVLGFPSRAEAYLDPTAGSMVMQVIMGAVMAASVMAKVYWRRIRSFFRGNGNPGTSRQ